MRVAFYIFLRPLLTWLLFTKHSRAVGSMRNEKPNEIVVLNDDLLRNKNKHSRKENDFAQPAKNNNKNNNIKYFFSHQNCLGLELTFSRKQNYYDAHSIYLFLSCFPSIFVLIDFVVFLFFFFLSEIRTRVRMAIFGNVKKPNFIDLSFNSF